MRKKSQLFNFIKIKMPMFYTHIEKVSGSKIRMKKTNGKGIYFMQRQDTVLLVFGYFDFRISKDPKENLK